MHSPSHAIVATEFIYNVVDDLLEHDLLGLLLSTTHLQRYCRIKAASVNVNEHADSLRALAASLAAATEFQHEAIRKFNSLHIPDIRFGSHYELAKHLDIKLKDIFDDSAESDDFIQASIEIENAWKYRRCCQGLRG